MPDTSTRMEYRSHSNARSVKQILHKRRTAQLRSMSSRTRKTAACLWQASHIGRIAEVRPRPTADPNNHFSTQGAPTAGGSPPELFLRARHSTDRNGPCKDHPVDNSARRPSQGNDLITIWYVGRSCLCRTLLVEAATVGANGRVLRCFPSQCAPTDQRRSRHGRS